MIDDRVEVVHAEGTADAPLLPVWAEHEMRHDQLAAPGEQIGQCLWTVGAIEDVGFLDPLPGQREPLRGQLVAQAGELLFFLQKPLRATVHCSAETTRCCILHSS